MSSDGYRIDYGMILSRPPIFQPFFKEDAEYHRERHWLN